MRTLGLAAAMVVAASQAHALSCMQPQIERSFNWWVEAEETYYIGVGSLEPNEALPKVSADFGFSDPNADRGPFTAQYTFSGRLLDGGQGVPFTAPITVTVSCLASWCGSFPQAGTSGLMALRGVGIQNLTLERGACPGSIFPADTEATVSECIRNGRCAEPAEQ